MKKTVCIGFLLIVNVFAVAQDTVRESSPWYMFKHHDDLIDAGSLPSHFNPIGTMLFQYYGKDSGDIDVYGVAYTAVYLPVAEDRAVEAIVMSPTVTLYSHVAHGNPPTVALLDSANVMGLLKQCRFEYREADGDSLIAPCYEYYFDTPHHFSSPDDTFYVARYWPWSRCLSYEKWLDWLFNEMGEDINDYLLTPIGATMQPPTATPENWQSFGATTTPENLILGVNWSGSTYVWGYLFPIVKLRCEAPSLRLAGYSGGNAATVSWWQAEAGETYQLSLGSYGIDPEEGQKITLTDTFHTFADLQADVIYQAWVRKGCRYTTGGYDTLVWSEWSHPATFRASVGIEEAEGDAGFTLTPNPVHGEVEVTLARPLSAEGELGLYDLGGREVRQVRVPAGSGRLTLDTEGCPAGAYLLKLVTPQGVATRRLLVE